MNPKDMKTEIAKVDPPKSLEQMIQSSQKELARALPSHLNAERLCRIALTCIRLNPELAKCTPASFLGSLFVLAQIGLEPVNGRSYLLPFNNRRKVGNQWVTQKEVQAIVGYKGLIELFYRHESALSIDMQTVHEKDGFQYEYGTSSYLKHEPNNGGRGGVIGFYAVAKMKGGASIFRYMSIEDATLHAEKHSKTFDKQKNEFYESSPWKKEFNAMAMKTVLIQLAKLLPLSVELQRAIAADETSREYRDGIDDALDLPVTTNWEEGSDAEPIEPEEKPKEKSDNPNSFENFKPGVK